GSQRSSGRFHRDPRLETNRGGRSQLVRRTRRRRHRPSGCRTLTTEELRVIIDKRAATRKARHTMGNRQKLCVVGAVPSPAPSTEATKPNHGETTNGSAVHPGVLLQGK